MLSRIQPRRNRKRRVTGEAVEKESRQGHREEKDTCQGHLLPQTGIQVTQKWGPRTLLFRQTQ